jgi:hypothetical protein
MKKSAGVGLLAVALVLVATVPSHAERRGFHGHPVRARVFIGVGPAFWWGPPYPYWYYPPPYYYGYPPPPVVIQEPPVVIQEPPVYIQTQPAAPVAPAPPSYWYYCPSAKGYYPNVSTCPEAWIKVPPRPQ